VEQRSIGNGGGPGFGLRRLVFGTGTDGQQIVLGRIGGHWIVAAQSSVSGIGPSQSARGHDCRCVAGCVGCRAADGIGGLSMAMGAFVAGVLLSEADAVIEEVRKRDAERFALETAGGLFAGRALVLGNIERIDPPNHEARDAQ